MRDGCQALFPPDPVLTNPAWCACAGLRKKEEMFSVRSLAFMPKINGVDQEGNPLLVVLHENTGTVLGGGRLLP